MMEEMLITPPKVPTEEVQKVELEECKTPSLPIQESAVNENEKDHNSSNNELRKPFNVTPDRLRVPKAFKYPERYTSPTDLMVSPVTKGLLARSKRGSALLPPGKFQQKDVGPFQNKVPVLIDENINSA